LKDLLIEFSVYVARTVEQMMTGKQFNRAVRALTLVYEALSLLWNNENFVCNQTFTISSRPSWKHLFDALTVLKMG
jgi:hypothetical protein